MSIRFFVAGYRKNKGYAIKDLSDGIVEYFSYEKVIDMSRKFKIYGVENRKINLDWFKSYYSRYAMIYGIDKASYDLGLIPDESGSLIVYNTGKNSDRNFRKFFEFTELFVELHNCSDGTIVRQELSDFVLSEIADNLTFKNSSFFHIKDKVKYIGNLDGKYINDLDISYMLGDDAEVSFVNHSYLSIENLRMSNCSYKVWNNNVLSLCSSIPDSTYLHVFVCGNSSIYISEKFNLERLVLDSVYDESGYHSIHIEDGVDVKKLLKLCSNIRLKLNLYRCVFNDKTAVLLYQSIEY